MAISIDGGSSDDKVLSPLNSDSSKNFKYKHKNKSHLIEMDFTSQRSIRRSTKLRKKVKSPYCAEDKMHLLSQMHEKREMRRKESGVISSFPMAAKIYKANSDEFNKMKTNKRKFKKSILTLPNEPSSTPQVYTVSDMNESEYNRNDRSVRKKQNCRAIYRHNSKPNNNERYFYDGGTQYYSKLKVDLGCSSSDIVKPLRRKRQKTLRNKHATAMCGNCNGGDVWAILRNIDRLQMRPSPPMSDDSLERLKNKSRLNKKRCTQKDARLIETCRTEEIAYISSYNVEDRSPISISPSSSYDRVTVIDNYNALDNLCESIIQPVRSQQSRDKKNNRIIVSNINKKTNIRPRFKETNKINYEERAFTNQKGKNLILQAANPVTNCKNRHIGGPCSTPTCPAITNNFCNEHNAPNYPIENFQGKGATVTSTESSRHVLKGITKVVLKENEKALHGVNDLPKRKPRLVTTMPSCCNSPKLTIFDKRRMLAKHKFPIIVLTKDQVNPVRISNFEFNQFAGLDQQIWPYMLDWFEKDPIKKNKLREQKKTIDQAIQKSDKISVQKPNDISSYHKKNVNKMNYNKNETQIEQEKAPKAPKCLNQIKDRMLQLLGQKSLTNNTTVRDLAISSPNAFGYIIKKQCSNGLVDVGTDPKVVHNSNSKAFCIRPPERLSPVTTRVPSPKTKQSQTLIKSSPKTSRNKQKCASDFIEDVIHKVKNGVYFNQNSVCLTTAKKSLSRITEFINEANKDLKSEIKESEICYELGETTASLLITNIPGFDKPLPALEVLNFADNRIVIKQRYTNITMQFDIDMIIPFEFSNLQKRDTAMTSLLNSCENHEPNILKYERTILNSVLPAELCSIVPKILRELSVGSSVKVNEMQPQLSTFAELPRCNRITAQFNSIMSPGKKMLRNGRYYHHVPSSFLSPVNRLKLNTSYFNDGSISKLLQNLEADKLFLLQKINLPRMLYLRQEKYQQPICTTDIHKDININLGLKSTKSLQLSEYRGIFDLRGFIEKIINSSNVTLVVNIQNFLTMYSFEFSKTTDLLIDKIVIKVTMDTYQHQASHNSMCQIKPMFASQPSSDIKSGRHIQRKNVISSKIRKTNYFKLYRKCKSMSNIPETKKCTPLDEVTNLEEFCQVLGSGKTLSSMFNGIEKLIMGCLIQLKTWISEISSTQAMLVILLLNKKDSPNLTRLRPVILQAIAVKRITRATELDMEVEVIENEKFKRLPEYTQMTHKPATLTVIDPDDESLLEELCWIAKTTASDYNRVYDETSEKLLKLLINKRKKLNPSYLRVMARYVGLGLLKSPGKL